MFHVFELNNLQKFNMKSTLKTPCDSGGATRNSYEILGVKSWGYGCGQASYPGVYTDVALFRKWIDSSIDKD